MSMGISTTPAHLMPPGPALMRNRLLMGVIGTARRTFIRTGIHKSPRAAVRRAAPRAAFLAALFLVLAFTHFVPKLSNPWAARVRRLAGLLSVRERAIPVTCSIATAAHGALRKRYAFGRADRDWHDIARRVAGYRQRGRTLGTMRLEGNTSGYVQVRKSAAAARNWTMTLPASTGTSGYVLQTDGTGVTLVEQRRRRARRSLSARNRRAPTNPQRTSEAGKPPSIQPRIDGCRCRQWRRGDAVEHGDEREHLCEHLQGGSEPRRAMGSRRKFVGPYPERGQRRIDAGDDGVERSHRYHAERHRPCGHRLGGHRAGAGSTAGLEFVANSLTTGNGEDID